MATPDTTTSESVVGLDDKSRPSLNVGTTEDSTRPAIITTPRPAQSGNVENDKENVMMDLDSPQPVDALDNEMSSESHSSSSSSSDTDPPPPVIVKKKTKKNKDKGKQKEKSVSPPSVHPIDGVNELNSMVSEFMARLWSPDMKALRENIPWICCIIMAIVMFSMWTSQPFPSPVVKRDSPLPSPPSDSDSDLSHDNYMYDARHAKKKKNIPAPGVIVSDHIGILPPSDSVIQSNTVTFLNKDRVLKFVRGYGRMYHICAEYARHTGLLALASLEQASSEMMATKVSPRITDRSYLGSASFYSPYFCVNFPLEMVTSMLYANDAIYNPSRKDRDTQLSSLIKNNIVLVNDKVLASYEITSGSVLTKSPLHTSEALWMLPTSFVHRNLELLGEPESYAWRRSNRAERTTLEVQHTPEPDDFGLIQLTYTALANSEAIRKLVNKALQSTDEQCICGPHLGLARHVVIYVSKRVPGKLYFEPVVIQQSKTGKNTKAVDVTMFPWIKPDPQQPLPPKADNSRTLFTFSALLGSEQQQPLEQPTTYADADNALRQLLQWSDKKIDVQTELYVDTFLLDVVQTRNAYQLKNSNQRTIMIVSDPMEAACIQYCEALAYSIREVAERQLVIDPETHCDRFKF